MLKKTAIEKYPVYKLQNLPYLNTPNRSGNITRHNYEDKFE
jgi:hypothetical protein